MARRLDVAHVAALLLVQRTELRVLQQSGEPEYRVERCADLVVHHRHQARLRLTLTLSRTSSHPLGYIGKDERDTGDDVAVADHRARGDAQVHLRFGYMQAALNTFTTQRAGEHGVGVGVPARQLPDVPADRLA